MFFPRFRYYVVDTNFDLVGTTIGEGGEQRAVTTSKQAGAQGRSHGAGDGSSGSRADAVALVYRIRQRAKVVAVEVYAEQVYVGGRGDAPGRRWMEVAVAIRSSALCAVIPAVVGPRLVLHVLVHESYNRTSFSGKILLPIKNENALDSRNQLAEIRRFMQ